MATFNLRRFASVDALKTIQEKHLRAFLAPSERYFTSRGVSLDGVPAGVGMGSGASSEPVVADDVDGLDYEGLISVFMLPDEDTPPELVDALYMVHEMATPEAMGGLLGAIEALPPQDRFVLDESPDPTPADVAVQVWLKAPRLLERKHSEQAMVGRRSFEYYLSREIPRRGFTLPSQSKLERVERDLAEWFVSKRRGEHVQVQMYPKGDEVWFLVRHGEPFRREGALKGHVSSSICFRPEHHDVLVYNTLIGELRMNTANKGDKDVYRRTFGLHLFGNEGHFPTTNRKYTLDPLRVDGKDSLVCTDVQGIDEIRLTEVKYYWGGPHGEIETRQASDLFAAMESRHASIRKGKIVSAKFQVKFSGSKSPRSLTIRQPNIAKFTRDDDGRLIDDWLLKRGFSSARRVPDEEVAEALVSA
ncbi:MAG: hypothetical protein ABIK85_07620 [Candidatus Eisenbacteria bacterium]